MMKFAVRTDNLTRDFGALRAVDGLTLEVPCGSIFGFLGPNGAGKTTTLRLLLGLLEPTVGCAEVLGFDTRLQADEIRQRTGVLLEHSGLYERLSAEDNLVFHGRIWRLPKKVRAKRIKTLLTHLELWERRMEPVGTWSRGMRQKLAIARALLHRPALVFLDEPTAGLDPVAASALRRDLAALSSQEGVTVFLTTHNLAEAEQICTQVGVLREGQLVAVGRPEELRARHDMLRVEVRGAGFDERLLMALQKRSGVASASVQGGRLKIVLHEAMDVAPLIRLIVGAGASVEEVHRNGGDLEAVFLQLMEESSHAR